MYACKYEFIKTGALNLHGDKEEGTNVGRIKWYTNPRVLLSFLFFFLHFSLPLPISSPCHSLHKRGRGNIARRKKGRVESLICSFVYYAVSTREWFVTGQRCVQTQSQGGGDGGRNGEGSEWKIQTRISFYYFHGPLFTDNFESGHLKRAYTKPSY